MTERTFSARLGWRYLLHAPESIDESTVLVAAAVLHIARRHDESYPPERTEQYVRRLRLRCDDVEFQLLEGAHRFPSRAGAVWENGLNRILR